MVEHGPELAGGTLAALATGGQSLPVQLAAGAGGAMMGEYVQQEMQLRDMYPGNPPDTTKGRLLKLARVGGEDLLGGVVSGIGSKVWNKAFGPNIGKADPKALEVENWINDHLDQVGKVLGSVDTNKALTKEGLIEAMQLTPGERTGAQMTQLLENLTEGALFTTSELSAKVQNRQSFMDFVGNRYTDSLVKLSQRDADTLGEIVVGSLEKRQEIAMKMARRSYDDVRTKIDESLESGLLKSEKFIPTKGLRINASKIKKEYDQIQAFADAELMQTINKVISKDGLDENLTYDAARALRTSLQQLEYKLFKQPGHGQSAQVIKEFRSIFDKSMNGALKKANAFDAWSKATKDYHYALNEFVPKSVRKVLKSAKTSEEFEKVIHKMWGNRNLTYTKDLMEMVKDDPVLTRKLQGSFMDRLIKGASDDVVNDQAQGISGHKLSNLMFARNGVGRSTLNRVLGEDSVKQLEQFAKVLSFQQRKYSGPGKMMIQFVQPQAIKQVAQMGLAATFASGGIGSQSAGVLTTAGLVLMGPVLFNKIAKSKKGMDWLTKGIAQISPGNTQKMAAAIKAFEKAAMWGEADSTEAGDKH